VPYAAKLGEPTLEFGDFAAHDEVRVLAYAQNGVIDSCAQPTPLRLQVDQGDRLYRILSDGR
jgi:hypothetical protein